MHPVRPASERAGTLLAANDDPIDWSQLFTVPASRGRATRVNLYVMESRHGPTGDRPAQTRRAS